MLAFFPAFVPNLLQVAPFVAAFSLLCAKPLHAHANWFYAGWTLVVAAVTVPDVAVALLGSAAPTPLVAASAQIAALEQNAPVLYALEVLFTSSFTGVCFYLIVMFAGAFDRTPLVKRLLSVRSELSILGGIVVLGHTLRVAALPFMMAESSMRTMWGSPAGELMFIASTVIGPPLAVLFVVLWVTSFPALRRRMDARTWKRVQRFAYPFMGLLCAQGLFLALAHALFGYPFDGVSLALSIAANPSGWLASFAQNVATAWMYLALGVGYLVLRLRKRARDRARREQVRSAAV